MNNLPNYEERKTAFIEKFDGNPTNGKVTLYLLKSCFKYFLVWLLIIICLGTIILIQIGVK